LVEFLLRERHTCDGAFIIDLFSRLHWLQASERINYCVKMVTYGTTAPDRYYPSTTLGHLCRADIGQDHSQALRVSVGGWNK